MTRSTRIGPRMQDALDILASCDGVAPSMLWLAEQVGPHGSRQYGYRTIHRLISMGLVSIDPDHPMASPHGQGAIVLVETQEEEAGR